jgi:uncharacterized protein
MIRSAETEFDIRSAAGGNTLIGHAAVFDIETVIGGMFRESIAPRAFRKSIKESDVRALFNHDPAHVLGRNKAGTLRLSEDAIGLHYEVDLPDTQTARDLWTSIDRGDITQSSFAFETVKEERVSPDQEAGETLPLFIQRECRLWDVSPVTYPAYEQTDVAARSAAERMAVAYGVPLGDVIEAANAGELARLWTPCATTTPQPPDEPQSPALGAGTPEPAKRNRIRELLEGSVA